MDGWVGGWMDGYMNAWTDHRMNKWAKGEMANEFLWMDKKWMHGCVHDPCLRKKLGEVCILTIITDVEKHGKISSLLSLFWGFFIAQNSNMQR